jgi:hypothetical protein
MRCAVPVFAATTTLTLALPVLPDPTLSHAALLVVVQAQVLPAVTATVTDSPAAGELRLLGAIPNVQGRPSCVTVNVWPAMVIVPVRCAVPVFAATMMPTVPLPVPVAPEPIVNHAALLVVLQAQVLPAVTPIATGSPAAGEVRLVGEIA